MSSGLSLNLLTPTAKLAFNLPIESLQVVTDRGEIEILKDHTSLVTTLGIGLLKYKEKTEEGQIKLRKRAIFWGYLEVFDNSVNILAETAEFPESIDKERALKALKMSTEKIEKGEDLEKNYIKEQKAKLRLALIEK